jgi:hypothetical protein
MLRLGSPRSNGARSAPTVPIKRHGSSVGALLFYLDQPNDLSNKTHRSIRMRGRKCLQSRPPPDRGDRAHSRPANEGAWIASNS